RRIAAPPYAVPFAFGPSRDSRPEADIQRHCECPMKRILATAVVILALAAVVPSAAAQQRANAGMITAERLKEFLSFIASDVTEGRGTPSRGLDSTAQYIASHLARWNLRSAVDDGGYFQRIRLTRRRIDT